MLMVNICFYMLHFKKFEEAGGPERFDGAVCMDFLQNICQT